jgi:hypothetical protein
MEFDPVDKIVLTNYLGGIRKEKDIITYLEVKLKKEGIFYGIGIHDSHVSFYCCLENEDKEKNFQKFIRPKYTSLVSLISDKKIKVKTQNKKKFNKSNTINFEKNLEKASSKINLLKELILYLGGGDMEFRYFGYSTINLKEFAKYGSKLSQKLLEREI